MKNLICGFGQEEYETLRALPPWPGDAGWVTDHFALGEVIGAGGEGRVVRGTPLSVRWGSAERSVAVKILDKEAKGLRFGSDTEGTAGRALKNHRLKNY